MMSTASRLRGHWLLRRGSGLQTHGSITREIERSLIQRYQDGQSAAGGTLVRAHAGLLLQIAMKLMRHGVELEDLFQEAQLGFLHAAGRFDLARDVKLITYAKHWARQAVRRYLHDHGRTVRVPVEVHELLRVATRAGAGADVPARARVLLQREVSLDATVSNDNERPLGTMLPAAGLSPEEQVAEHEADQRRKDAVERALARLTTRERGVVIGRMAGETFAALGEGFGISKERTRHVEQHAFQKLRVSLRQQAAAEGLL